MGVLVWLCAWMHVFPLVLTNLTVKSYSPRQTIGTGQTIGQQGGLLACLLAIKKDRLKA